MKAADVAAAFTLSPESTLMVVQHFEKVCDGCVLFGEHHELARQPALLVAD